MTGGTAQAPLALTMGEPAGIGGEVALKAWMARDRGLPPFFVIDDPARLAAAAADLRLDARVRTVSDPSEASAVFPDALPVLPEPLIRPVAPGRPDPANAPAVLGSIRRAVEAAASGAASAVVTNSINKKVLSDWGFPHPGHTEYLAELTGTAMPVMMLACPGLRVVPVTIHQPLREAIPAISAEGIVSRARICHRALITDFAIRAPRLVVAGLNPHAGEGGMLGREETEIIAPAVEALKAEGIAVSGPLPADSLFHPRARADFDAAICMYHDQALIPLKTIDFDHGVDVTLGLPIVRSSPDHGTAFDIAGKGIASAESLMAALSLAHDMAANRARAGERRGPRRALA